MEHYLGLVENIGSFTFSAVSNSIRISFMPRNRWGSSHVPAFVPPLELSSREVQHEDSTNGKHFRKKAIELTSLSSVIMKELPPFYDHQKDIFKSWYLAPVFHVRKNFTFSIKFVEEDFKILLRFCRWDSSCKQDDRYPPELLVQVNGKVCDTKGGSVPIDITALCEITTGMANRMQVSTSLGHGEYYMVSLSLVKKLTVNDLLHKLRTKKLSKIQDTKALIKSRLKQDEGSDGIATTTLHCSLVCPLTMTRISVPCRGMYCQHFQCFDAAAYLQVNEQKSLWICPVCNCSALFPDLIIDGYFQEVLAQANECSKVSLLQDGSWTPVAVCDQQIQTRKHQGTKRKQTFVEMVVIDSDEECHFIENEKEAAVKIREANRVLHNTRSHQKNTSVGPLETCRSSQREKSKRQQKKRNRRRR